jgi:hypothetical protein
MGFFPEKDDAVHVEIYGAFKQALCSASQMGLRCPSGVKTGMAQTEQMFSGLCLKADARRL